MSFPLCCITTLGMYYSHEPFPRKGNKYYAHGVLLETFIETMKSRELCKQ